MIDFLKIAGLLLIPLCISLGIVHILAQKLLHPTPNNKETKFLSKIKTMFSFTPDKGLSHQPPLWMAFLVPLSYFLTLGYFSWKGHSVLITAEGFKKFIELSTLPLALLSLCIPIAVLVSRLHATQQTAIQIIVTKQKNNVDAFYAHRKAMNEYFASLKHHKYEGCIDGDFEYHPRLHLKFFSHQNPEEGIPSPNIKQLQNCLTLLDEARTNISQMISLRFSLNTIDNYFRATEKVSALAKIMVISQIYKHETFWEKKDNKTTNQLITIGTSIHDLIGAYRYSRSYLRIICEFSGYSTEWFDNPNISDYQRHADKYPIRLSGGQGPGYMQEVHRLLREQDYLKL